MIDVGTYQKTCKIQKDHTRNIFNDFGHLIQWREAHETKILDVGCGEGSTLVNILKPLIEKHVKTYRIVGIDVLETMISTANKNFGDEKYVEFLEMDIGCGKVPISFEGNFDHIFSIICLHWVSNLQWVKNVYDMLKPNGQIFLFVPLVAPIIQAFRELAQHDKWKQYQNSNRVFDNPFLNLPEPNIWLKPIMESVGFIDIYMQQVTYKAIIPNKKYFQEMLRGAPGQFETIPKDLIEEFLHDYTELIINKYSNPISAEEFCFPCTYILIIANR